MTDGLVDSLDRTAEIGARIRRLRRVAGLSQSELAETAKVSSGLMSHIETGRSAAPTDVLARIAAVLECQPTFLTSVRSRQLPTRPWLRAYADAPQKELDRHLGDVANLVDVVDAMKLRRIPVTLPVFGGDLDDETEIEDFAHHVRVLAGVEELDVLGHVTYLAELLGCVVVPMTGELGRHLGLSTRFGAMPVIAVNRPELAEDGFIAGDRQRLTVAHELGHLVLHADLDFEDRDQARRIERQAFRFGAALLAPAEAMMQELEEAHGRVTLRTLTGIKARWGVSIKMLVGRFKDLHVISDEQARSLYKQISARGFNQREPIEVGHEEAVWLSSSLAEAGGGDLNRAIALAASRTGIGRAHIERWVDWSPTRHDAGQSMATVTPLRRSDRD